MKAVLAGSGQWWVFDACLYPKNSLFDLNWAFILTIQGIGSSIVGPDKGLLLWGKRIPADADR